MLVRAFVTGVFLYTRVRVRGARLLSAVAVLILLGVGVGLLHPGQATATPANTINFQARLETAGGAIAADGTYNVEFKLYSASSGGTALWTEDYLVSGSNGIRTANGYLTANLGSATAFPNTINWGQQLYLTMNIGGTGGSATWDGEMSPRLSLTSVPSAFAINSYNSTLGYTGSLTVAQPTGGSQTFVVPDQGAAGSYTLLTTNTANTSFIQNSASVQSGATFNVGGNGVIGGTLSVTGLATLSGGFGSTGSSASYLGGAAVGAAILTVNTNASNRVGLIVKGTSGQTFDLVTLQNSSGTVLSGFNSLGQFYNQSGLYSGTFASSTLSANRTYTFPNASGNVCLDTNNCNTTTTTTGATNYVARFTGANTLGIGLLYDDSTFVGVNTATQIASATNTLNVLGAGSSVALAVQGAASQDIADFYTSGGAKNLYIANTGRLNAVAGLSTSGSSAVTAQTAVVSAANTNASATLSTVSGLQVTVSGTANASGSFNVNNAINLANATAASGNSFNGIYVGSGYNSILNYAGASLISGTGLVQNVALDSTLNYSNLQAVTNLSVTGTLGVTGLSSLSAVTAVGTANINASGTAATNIGNSGAPLTIAGNAASGSVGILKVRVSGDSVDRFTVAADGTLSWSSGSTANDLNLYRASAGNLKTDNNFQVAGSTGISLLNNSSAILFGTGSDISLTRTAAGTLRVVGSGSATSTSLLIKAISTQGSTDLLTLQDSSNNVLSGFSGSGQLYFQNSGFAGTISQGTLTAARTYTLPDLSGTICLSSNNCGGGTVSGTTGYVARFTSSSALGTGLLYDNASFVSLNNAAAQLNGSTFGVQAAASSVGLSVKGSGTDIADFLGSGGTVVASINNSGRITAGGGVYSSSLDTAAAGALALGGTNATSITLNANTSLGAAKTFTTNGSGFDGSGNLGIGTTSPAYNLTVKTSPSYAGVIGIKADATYGAGPVLFLQEYGGTQTYKQYVDNSGNFIFKSPNDTTLLTGSNIGVTMSRLILSSPGALSSPSLTLDITSGSETGLYLPATNTIGFITARTERARIDANGNFGIGTTSPGAYRLNVQGGDTNLSGNLTVGGTYNSNTFTSSALTFGAASAATIQSATGQNLVLDSGGGGQVNLGTTNATAINLNKNTTVATGKTFTTNGSGFDASGNLGVGTVAPTTALQIVTNNSSVSSPQVLIQQDGSGDSSLQYKSSTKSFYTGLDASDGSTFKISSSTSAGGVQTFGNTATAGTTDSANQNVYECTQFTAGYGGTVNSITVNFRNIDTTLNQGQAAIYSNGASVPGTRLGSSASKTLVTGQNNFVLTTSVSVVSGTVYWLCSDSNINVSNKNNLVYDTGSAGQSKSISSGFSYGTWPATMAAPAGSYNLQTELYATISLPTADEFGASLFSLTDIGQASFSNAVDSSTAFRIQNAAGTSLLTADTSALTVALNGALTVSGTYNTNTFNGNTLTFGSASAATVSSAAGQQLTLASGSGTLGFGSTTTTLQRTASGTTFFDLKDAGTTTLQLWNSGAGVANLNLYAGSLTMGSTPVTRIDNAGNFYSNTEVVSPTTDAANVFQVQDAMDANVIGVDTTSTNYAVNGGAENNATFATNWTQYTAATVARTTTANQFLSGAAAVSVTTTVGTARGVKNNLGVALTVGSTYLVSFSIKASTGSFADIAGTYLYNGTAVDAGTNTCTAANTPTVSTTWVKVNCSITVGTAGTTGAAFAIYGALAKTIYIDNFSITKQMTDGSLTVQQVRIGGISGQGLTLLTVDTAAAPPTDNTVINSALYGSIYYDTALGSLQCYGTSGWGACGVSPNIGVNLIPEYSGAVLDGTKWGANKIGTMTSGLCSGSSRLSVNTSLCGATDDYNYYAWTSPQATSQTYSIFVRYQLPATFKSFTSSAYPTLSGYSTNVATSATGSAQYGGVQFSMFDAAGNTCGGTGTHGTGVTAVTTTGSTWQTGTLTPTASGLCTFTAGDTITFRIDVTSINNSNAYASNLSFLTIGK